MQVLSKLIRILVLSIVKKQTPVLTPSQLLHSILVFMAYFEDLELLKAAIDIHTVIIVTEVRDKKIYDADGWCSRVYPFPFA